MKDQHEKIPGYSELSDKIAMLNDIKRHGEQLKDLADCLRDVEELDQRWVSIGRTHLQQGIMALVRAVAKPDSF